MDDKFICWELLDGVKTSGGGWALGPLVGYIQVDPWVLSHLTCIDYKHILTWNPLPPLELPVHVQLAVAVCDPFHHLVLAQ